MQNSNRGVFRLITTIAATLAATAAGAVDITSGDWKFSVDGNINDSTFGQVVSAAAPRLLQAGVKFTF